MLFFTILVMFTFGTFSLRLILIMRDTEKMPPNLLGDSRRILVDPVSNLSKILSASDTEFNGCSISEGKVFLVSSSFRRHK